MKRLYMFDDFNWLKEPGLIGEHKGKRYDTGLWKQFSHLLAKKAGTHAAETVASICKQLYISYLQLKR